MGNMIGMGIFFILLSLRFSITKGEIVKWSLHWKVECPGVECKTYVYIFRLRQKERKGGKGGNNGDWAGINFKFFFFFFFGVWDWD